MPSRPSRQRGSPPSVETRRRNDPGAPNGGHSRWYLARRPLRKGPGFEYVVYVDGQLVTSGHASAKQAVVAAERLIGSANGARLPNAPGAPR